MVLAGAGIEWLTTNATIETDGWVVVVVAVLLWLLKEFKYKL